MEEPDRSRYQFRGLPDDALSRAPSQEFELSTAQHKLRKPSRAVFKDLHTAHSSITSGHRGPSNPRSESSNEGDRNSTPVEDGAPSRPLPQLPVVVFHGRYVDAEVVSQSKVTTSDQRAKPTHHFQSKLKGFPGSLHANIKNALGSTSSPYTPNLHPQNGGSPDLKRKGEAFDPDDPSTPSLRNAKRKATGASRDRSSEWTDVDSSTHYSNIGANPSGWLASNNNSGHENGDDKSFMESRQFNSGRTAPEDLSYEDDSPSLPKHGRAFKRSLSSRHSISSVPSTIGNIYKHYAGSEELNGPSSPNFNGRHFSRRSSDNHRDLSSNSLAGDLIASELRIPKQRDIGTSSQRQPPKFSLPNVSHLAVPIGSNSSRNFGPSSSYGDTRELLEIPSGVPTSNSLHRENARYNFDTDQGSPADVSFTGRTSALQYPFNFATPPQLVLSHATGANWVLEDVDREPLEREVSKALRRISVYSAYSNDTRASGVLRGNNETSSQATSSQLARFLNRLTLQDTPPSDSGSFNNDGSGPAPAPRAFYDGQIIPSDWVSSQQDVAVRVPVGNSILPESPPDTPLDLPKVSLETDRHGQHRVHIKEDANNDWETVGETLAVPGFRGQQTPVGGIHRAGSSLADISDGDISTGDSVLPSMDVYGSSERITQHPGTAEFHGDYRQRELKNTNIPVFLPVFREHKVNGYLADSNRTRPPPVNQFNFSRPLTSHDNPFKSPPPEVMTIRGVRPSQGFRSISERQPAVATHSLDTLKTSQSSTDLTEQYQLARYPDERPLPTLQPTSRISSWIDEFGSTGAAGSMQRNQWLHGDIPTLRLEDSLIGRALTDPDSPVEQHPLTSQLQHIEGSERGQTPTPAASRILLKQRDRKAMPPGAFYQGLRASSRKDSMDRRSLSSRDNGHRTSTKQYPTNKLRPLSLRADRPMTPLDQIGMGPTEEVRENDFVYRSPLAPPKRGSLADLYSRAQWTNIKTSAQADGFSELQNPMNTGKRMTSRMHLGENPCLRGASRESSSASLMKRKTKISTVALVLCNIFPPSLILYSTGRLDGIMAWWTDEELLGFSKREKKYAFVLMVTWGLLLIVGLAAFLIVWFTTLRHA